MSHLLRCASAFVVAALLGCASEPRITNTPTMAATAPQAEPSPYAPSEAPTASVSCRLPPVDMLADNIATTTMSGIAEIVASTRTDADPSHYDINGYDIVSRYELHVVRWFAGSGTDPLVLRADYAPFTPPGQLLFFSVCRSADGSAYEPDNGYVFPIDPACRANVEKLGEIAKRAGPSASRQPNACAP